MEFTKEELIQMSLNLQGFTNETMLSAVDKIDSEIERLEELEDLDFDDCESCKL